MLIGLAGKAGSGKDTVAAVLRRIYKFETVSFAKPIKRALCALLDVPMHKWDDREWRETVLPVWEQTPRYLAQTLGTEWGRDVVKQSLWLDLAFEQVKQHKNVVITDIRFNNENSRVRDEGGHVIHVTRAEANTIGSPSHSSEAGVYILAKDFFIENSGTIRALHEKVKDVIEKMKNLELRQATWSKKRKL